MEKQDAGRNKIPVLVSPGRFLKTADERYRVGALGFYITKAVAMSEGGTMHEVLKCNLCGKVIMILEEGGRRTICCDQLMEKLAEQGDKKAKHNHVPVIEKTRKGIVVKVSGLADPMGDDHYLQWIEVSEDGTWMMKVLNPGDHPAADFPFGDQDVKVRALCSRHGLWSNKPPGSPV